MMVAETILLKQIEEFKLNKKGIEKENKDEEILMINKLVKAEVIDVAVMMDELTS